MRSPCFKYFCFLGFDFDIYYGVWLVFSESYHWTRWIADTCLRADTCPNLDVSSDNFHWTQALPFIMPSSLPSDGKSIDPTFICAS